MTAKRATLLLLLPLLAAVMACTEDDENLVPIGVMRLVVADSGIANAALDSPNIQYAEWDVTLARVTLGDDTLDLLGADSCEVFDSTVLLPTLVGKCASGVVAGATDERVPATLAFRATMNVKRAEPVDLPPGGDFDGDGVTNDTDICPLVDNPGQEDADMNGFGDACEGVSPISAMAEVDSDADGVTDDVDNCIHTVNALQLDSSPVPDGIGDACNEQPATVTLSMSTNIRIDFDAGRHRQRQSESSFLVVDFDNTRALTCDFDAGNCDLSGTDVLTCFRDDVFAASAGCQ